MIIATKLHIPYIRAPFITRSRLIKKLDEGLNHTLTLITAPAGYGKTTVLSQWAASSSIPASWVSLDHTDNQFLQFWSHSLAALKEASPSFDEQGILHYYEIDPSGTSLIAYLINELHRLPMETVLIWDDFHYIENQRILDSIDYVLQRLPSQVHLYIASRTLPTLSLARLNTRGELNQLSIDDLRFTLEETQDYIRTHQLSKSLDTAIVYERTEGWITGLRLAALSLSDKTNQYEQAPYLTGDKKVIADYFFEEVFTKQTADIQTFLLKTSVLERMNSELCAVLTEIENSVAILHYLEQIQLFIIPLDDRREWYRYHHLFQQFLRERLRLYEPQLLKKLHMAAGHWLGEKQYDHEAIEHYLAGACYEEAMRSLQSMLPRLKDYERPALHQWLNQVPSPLLFQKPNLYLTNIASLFLSGKIEESTEQYWWAIHRLNEAQHSLSAEEVHTFYTGLSFLVAFRGYLERDFATCLEYSKDYLARDPNGNFMIGFGTNQEGYHPVWDIHVSSDHLPKAEQILKDLLQLWSATNNVYFIAHLCIDYGNLLYEWNRLEEARQYLQRSLEIGQTHHNTSLVVIASVWLAYIDRAAGEWPIAQRRLDTLKKNVNALSHPRLTRLIEVHQAQLHRIQGQTKQAVDWVGKSKLNADDEISFSMIEEYELLAIVMAEQGETAAALNLITHLFQLSKKENAHTKSLRLLLRKSLLLEQLGLEEQSIEVLEEALCLGEMDGCLRSFVDEGTSLIPLLSKYINVRQNNHRPPKNKVSLAYVKRLSYLLSMEQSKNRGNLEQETDHHIDVINSLTAQEKTVLALIQAGLKNKEIAERLNISLSTVKTHINNIYHKLQVNNRFMAVQRAKEWGG